MPPVYSMVSADELRQQAAAESEPGGTAVGLPPMEPHLSLTAPLDPAASAAESEQSEVYVSQLESELESMRRMLTELRLRELGNQHMRDQQFGQMASSAGGGKRDSASALFAQELERMESGGYVVTRSQLDSPVKSNTVGGKGKGRAGGGGGSGGGGGGGGAPDTRTRRRHARPSAQPAGKAAAHHEEAPPSKAVFMQHSAQLKRELLNLRAGLENVKSGGTAMESTLGATQMASAIAEGLMSAVPEPEPEPEPEPRPELEPEPEPAARAQPAVAVAPVAAPVLQQPRVSLPQIRGAGTAAPAAVRQPAARRQRLRVSDIGGGGGALRRGRRREGVRKLEEKPTAKPAPQVAAESSHVRQALPRQTRRAAVAQKRVALPAVRQRNAARKSTSPVFDRPETISPENIGQRVNLPAVKSKHTVDQLDVFLVPAGRAAGRRRRRR